TGNGTPVSRTTTTNGVGIYFFDGLAPGTYKVTFELPSGYEFTYANQGIDDTTDSDADQNNGMTVNKTLVSGENYPDFDAGILNTGNTKIGNFVWEDLNGNGIQDGGEPGIEDVEVRLTGTTGNGTAVDLTTTTDGTGMYMFGNLFPGIYKLTFVEPSGFEFTYSNQGADDSRDSDADESNGMTVTETLVSGEYNDTYDAGLVNTGNTKIGDFAFFDCNENGIQDDDENGLPGVPVVLNGTDGGGNAVNRNTTTDATGYYIFENLRPGNYRVTFGFPVSPTGLAYTQMDQGGNDAKDSDANPLSGATNNYTIVSGEINLTIDAGYKDATAPN